MVSRVGRFNWVVLVVLLLTLLSSFATAAESDPAVATEQKISVIPEPVTLLVLIAGLMLFGWKRTHKSRSRAAVTAARD